MSEEDYVVGRCCKSESAYLVCFNGSPSRNYAVYLCGLHFNKSPYDKNILKISKLDDA